VQPREPLQPPQDAANRRGVCRVEPRATGEAGAEGGAVIETQNVRVVNTVQEVCHIVRQAAAEDKAVYPVGGRTMLDLGLPPTKPGYAVDLTSLNKVIDYP